MDLYKKRILKRIYIFENNKFILKFEDGSVSNFIVDNFHISINNQKKDLSFLIEKGSDKLHQKEIKYISQVEIFPKKNQHFDYIYEGFKKSGKQVDFLNYNSFIFILHTHTINESFLISLIFLKNEFFIIPIFNTKSNNSIDEIKKLKVYKDFLLLSQNSEEEKFSNLIHSLNHIEKSTILEFIF